MTQVDATGGNMPISVLESVGFSYPAIVKDSAGNPVDLTDKTITAVLADIPDDGSYGGSITEYSQVITEAAEGEFTFAIPYAAFTNKAGQCLSYSLYMTSGGVRQAYLSGIISVKERV